MKWYIFPAILIVYYIFINLIFYISNVEVNMNMENETKTSSEQIGMGNSISVSVEKNRFYGHITEISTADYKISKLYFLGFIPIPLHSRYINLNYFNFAFLIFLFGFILLAILKSERRYEY